MKLNSIITSTFQNLKTNAVRFPLAVICAGLFFIFCLNTIYDWDWFNSEKETRVAAILVAGFFWFGGCKLFCESRNKSAPIYFAIAIPIFAIIATYIYCGHYGLSVFNFIISGLISFVTVAAFLKRNSTDSAFYNFNLQLGIGIFYSILLTLIFCAGLSAILATINQLFSIHINHRIYSSVWAFGGTFLAPYYALSWVSKDFNVDEDAYIPKGVKFILSYILVPFGIIYFLILYAYALKIFFQWHLPQGQLSYMICGFGAVGSFVHLAAYPLRNSGNYLVRKFENYFCLIFLPLIPLLFLAIFVRIREYGITESRYAIVLAGIWFTAITINYLRCKDNYSMKYGPAVLAILMILASFGPWGAVNVSEKSQVHRLENLLSKNHILENGKIIPAKSDVVANERVEITSIVEYLSRTDKLDAIKSWFDSDATINKMSKFSYSNAYEIVRELGIKPTSKWDINSKSDNTFQFNSYDSDMAPDKNVVEVAGYDYYIPNLYNTRIRTPSNSASPVVTLEKNILVLTFTDSHQVKIDLEPLVKDLQQSQPKDVSKKLILTTEDDQYKIKLHFTSLNGKTEHGIEVTYISFGLLYKKK